jgi:hypothetical protein
VHASRLLKMHVHDGRHGGGGLLRTLTAASKFQEGGAPSLERPCRGLTCSLRRASVKSEWDREGERERQWGRTYGYYGERPRDDGAGVQ